MTGSGAVAAVESARAPAPFRPASTPPLSAPTALPQHPRRGAEPGLVLGLIWLGAALSVWLWWRNTASVSGLGEVLTNAGRVTGLLAGYSAAVLLLLMARVPALERGIGSDRLARWHSSGGRFMVSVTVAHALLILWGYTVTAHTSVVSEARTLLLSYPDVMMATVALGLFVMVGVVSARAARRRLRYETWYYLHLYTYLAVALAFSHQFATGAEFISNRPARIAWSALYLGVAALLLWFRVLTPVRQALRHRLRIVDVQRHNDEVVSVYVSGRHLDELGAVSGQFFRWRFLTRSHWWASNPYSLSSPPRQGLLRITVKSLGDHSQALAGLRPGTRVLAEGPYGALTGAHRTREHVLLVAGGVGVTVVRALFESLPGRPGTITVIYRASSEQDLVLRDELDAIAAARGCTVHYVTGRRDEWGHTQPLSPEHLRHLVPDVADHDVYVCGPEGMQDTVVRSLRSVGVPSSQIHTESFAF